MILDEKLTRRDWLAGQVVSAMNGIRSDGAYSKDDYAAGNPELEATWIAKQAYRIADAMIAEADIEVK